MVQESGRDPRQDGWLDLMLGPAFALGGYLLGQSISYGSLGGVRVVLGYAIMGVGFVLGAWYVFRAYRLLVGR